MEIHTIELKICDWGDGCSTFQLRELRAQKQRGQISSVRLDTGEITGPTSYTLRLHTSPRGGCKSISSPHLSINSHSSPVDVRLFGYQPKKKKRKEKHFHLVFLGGGAY